MSSKPSHTFEVPVAIAGKVREANIAIDKQQAYLRGVAEIIAAMNQVPLDETNVLFSEDGSKIFLFAENNSANE